jgi:hypothetical protein
LQIQKAAVGLVHETRKYLVGMADDPKGVDEPAWQTTNAEVIILRSRVRDKETKAHLNDLLKYCFALHESIPSAKSATPEDINRSKACLSQLNLRIEELLTQLDEAGEL